MRKSTHDHPGQPTLYTEKIAMKICERLSNGESLISIGKDKKMPARSTVLNWLLQPEFAQFLDKYTQAREHQADHFVEEINDITKDTNKDTAFADRLKFDAKKWMSSVMKPHKYDNTYRAKMAETVEKRRPITVNVNLSEELMDEVNEN